MVWNQAVKAEANVANGGSSASVLMDLKSFFDTIDFDLLLERCIDTHFSMVLAQMAIAAYKAPRSVSVRRAIAAPVNATRGILAGHVFALALVQVYYLPVMDAFWARHLDVDIDIYVDDITLTVHGKDDDDDATCCRSSSTGCVAPWPQGRLPLLPPMRPWPGVFAPLWARLLASLPRLRRTSGWTTELGGAEASLESTPAEEADSRKVRREEERSVRCGR